VYNFNIDMILLILSYYLFFQSYNNGQVGRVTSIRRNSMLLVVDNVFKHSTALLPHILFVIYTSSISVPFIFGTRESGASHGLDEHDVRCHPNHPIFQTARHSPCFHGHPTPGLATISHLHGCLVPSSS